MRVHLLPGSILENSVVCPIGLHCLNASAEPLSCQSGTFTNRTGMWECEICPDGWVGLGQMRGGAGWSSV